MKYNGKNQTKFDVLSTQFSADWWLK